MPLHYLKMSVEVLDLNDYAMPLLIDIEKNIMNMMAHAFS
jgi:hypothetical protein